LYTFSIDYYYLGNDKPPDFSQDEQENRKNTSRTINSKRRC